WAVFTLPLMTFVREDTTGASGTRRTVVRDSLGEVWATLRRIRAHRTIVTFLVAYWLYIDGVGTVATMALNYGVSLGLQDREFFGFYNMLGKFAAIVGPLLMGGAALITGSPRAGVLAITVLFAAGGLVLATVRLPDSQR